MSLDTECASSASPNTPAHSLKLRFVRDDDAVCSLEFAEADGTRAPRLTN